MAENLEPLKPLTPQEQELFERQRESGSVVQHKCAKCGAWYETPKKAADFIESFMCDCGSIMSYTVPALDLISKPEAADMGLISSGGLLDTGMTVREAIAQTRSWWDHIGRKEIANTRDKTKKMPFLTKDPDDENFLPSGVMHGNPWDELTKREQIQIVKAHHHFYVRKPQILGETKTTQ